MKYHRLLPEQFETLHKEFATFLAANGIDKSKWDVIKQEEDVLMNSYLDTFSDVVWEKILEQCDYLEFSDARHFFLFHCQKEQMQTFVIKVAQACPDLNTEAGGQWLDRHWQTDAVEILEGQKAYSKERAAVLYDFLRKGAVITKGVRYKAFKSYFSNSAK